jgi:PleD family two-component response regulator
VNEAKPSLLIVEDDLDIAEMLNAFFRLQGYDASVVNWGEDGVKQANALQPDLVILDIRLPDINGFEVARLLRANHKTRDIPIMFLTEQKDRADRLEGLALKPEDYITKPFDIQELRLRVNNIIERRRRKTVSNAITGLPEGNLVDERLKGCLPSPDYSISVISLKNFGHFRELYGFVAADDLLRAVSMMLVDVLRTYGTPEDFLGHLDQTNFVFISPPLSHGNLNEQISKRLLPSLDYFYRDQDKESISYREHRLAVEIYGFDAAHLRNLDAQQLRVELNRLCRR